MGVLDFKRPEADEPHASGECVCRHCKHEWVGIAPVGSNQLECPQCFTHHGSFKYPFGAAAGEFEYRCNCGSNDFFIMKREASKVAAVYCRGCGMEATGWFE